MVKTREDRLQRLRSKLINDPLLLQSAGTSDVTKNTGVNFNRISTPNKTSTAFKSYIPNNHVLHSNDFERSESRSLKPQSNSKVRKSSILENAVLRLESARFRKINEQLYSINSVEAGQLFNCDATLYELYHKGYQQQVAKWPVNPLDLIVQKLSKRSKSLIIADMGCGDAKLADNVRQIVHSFDLVAANSRVTACDMSKVPLESSTVDVCVFCLSLMGTNISDFIVEANRILKMHGILFIAEITSRFPSSVKEFRRAIEKFGFRFKRKEFPNKMFVIMEFTKTGEPLKVANHGLNLNPCLYKRR